MIKSILDAEFEQLELKQACFTKKYTYFNYIYIS